MSTESVSDLLLDEVEDLYSAEQQLVKALPKMAKAAVNPQLKAGFLEHLEQTKGHVTRLEEAFKILGAKPKAKLCRAMKGLVEEGATDKKLTTLSTTVNREALAEADES